MRVVILAGGEGKRLYPLSTLDKPKQFLKLGNSKYSLLQKTYLRFRKSKKVKDIIIVTNKRYEELVEKDIKKIDKNFHVVLEKEKEILI